MGYSYRGVRNLAGELHFLLADGDCGCARKSGLGKGKRWHSESAPSRFFSRPIVGVAWSSKGLSPAQRSVAPRSRPRSNPSRFERAFPWRRKSVLAFHRNLPQSKTGTRRPRLWNMHAAADSVEMRNAKSRALRFWDPIRGLS